MSIEEKALKRIQELNITKSHNARYYKAGYMAGYMEGCGEAMRRISEYVIKGMYGNNAFPDAEARPITKAETR